MIDTQLTADKTPTQEEGATLVFVAVVLVALLALTAFAVDFGRMWEERRQLQNGADAAALAIAEECDEGLCGAGYDEYATAENYVDENARDGLANAWLVDLDLDSQTVTVHNRTEDPGGDHKFDMLFAGIVGFDGFTVGADATVAWGNALQIAAFPIIISDCEWIRDTEGWPNGGGNLTIVDPPGPDYDTDTFVVLTFHNGNNTEECDAQAGQDSPLIGDDKLDGGFGFLASDDCTAEIFGDIDLTGPEPEYGWAQAQPGASQPDCSADQMEDILGSTIFIPWFDGIWSGQQQGSPCNEGQGATQKCYHIAGYGGFHVIGYNFGGQYKAYSEPLTSVPCQGNGVRPPGWQHGNNDDCLVGYFTNKTYTGPADIGGDDRGVSVVKFIS